MYKFCFVKRNIQLYICTYLNVKIATKKFTQSMSKTILKYLWISWTINLPIIQQYGIEAVSFNWSNKF